MFLFMAHPKLPEKMAGILHTKLKDHDVASLKDMILERGQEALEELEGSHASVNRMNHRPQQSRPQYNRGYQPRAPQGGRQNHRQDQRTGSAARRYNTPSPTRAPRNPDHYCCLCLRDPQRRKGTPKQDLTKGQMANESHGTKCQHQNDEHGRRLLQSGRNTWRR